MIKTREQTAERAAAQLLPAVNVITLSRLLLVLSMGVGGFECGEGSLPGLRHPSTTQCPKRRSTRECRRTEVAPEIGAALGGGLGAEAKPEPPRWPGYARETTGPPSSTSGTSTSLTR